MYYYICDAENLSVFLIVHTWLPGISGGKQTEKQLFVGEIIQQDADNNPLIKIVILGKNEQTDLLFIQCDKPRGYDFTSQ